LYGLAKGWEMVVQRIARGNRPMMRIAMTKDQAQRTSY